jgi:hypothetical protein
MILAALVKAHTGLQISFLTDDDLHRRPVAGYLAGATESARPPRRDSIKAPAAGEHEPEDSNPNASRGAAGDLGDRRARRRTAVVADLCRFGLLATVDRLSVQTFVFLLEGRIGTFSTPRNCNDEETVKVMSGPLLRHPRCVASVR